MELRNLAAKIRNDAKYTPKRSFEWFKTKIQELGNINPKTYVDKATFTNIRPGNFYLFAYDPKMKDKLPYYDRYPLVIPFNKDESSFIGLNLHYLHPRTRLILLNKLTSFKIPDTNHEHKLLLQWRLISNFAKYPEVAPCVKRYLYSHCKSKFLRIPEDDWIVISQMPTDLFRKDKNTNVWADSRARIGR